MSHRRTLRFALLAAALLAASSAGADVTLKIATVVPDGSDWMNTMRAGVAEIAERTAGRVKIKLYGGGVQGNDTQVLRKMRIGQLNGGVFTYGGLGDVQKDAQIYGLPRLFHDFDEVRYVRERMDETFYQRLDEAGFVTFGFAGGGFAYLFSKQPVANREELGKLKLWIPEGDKVAQLASDALGASPVTLQLTDVLTGLQTDLIDSVMGPPVGVIVFQWHTAMNDITDLPLAYVYAGLLIDKRAWGKIAAEDQAVVREVMTRIYEGFDAKGVEDHEAALAALREQGLNMVPLDAGELPIWDRSFQKANDAAGQAGAFDPELLKQVECHLSVYRGEAEAGSCS